LGEDLRDELVKPLALRSEQLPAGELGYTPGLCRDECCLSLPQPARSVAVRGSLSMVATRSAIPAL
jgi:hypothetical protein